MVYIKTQWLQVCNGKWSHNGVKIYDYIMNNANVYTMMIEPKWYLWNIWQCWQVCNGKWSHRVVKVYDFIIHSKNDYTMMVGQNVIPEIVDNVDNKWLIPSVINNGRMISLK